MKKQNITLKDVARAAKISISTASKAINNMDGVSENTRKRVLKVADKLGYHASFIPRSLRTKNSEAIGLILPNILNPFFCALTNGVEDTALNNNYVVILGSAKKDLKRESSYFNIFSERWIDGIILAGGIREEDKVYIDYSKEKGIPIVFLNTEIEEYFANSIGIDNEMAMYRATKYLIELGHRQIGFISGPLKVRVFCKRVEGYKRALKSSGMEIRGNLIEEGDEMPAGGKIATRKLLERNEGITAILTSNDMMAIGSLKELSDKGLRVPEEISVMGFDDIPLASVVTPSLTTVSQPAYAMGMEGVELLLEVIQGKKMAKSKIILSTEIIVRDSTCSPKKSGKSNSNRIDSYSKV